MSVKELSWIGPISYAQPQGKGDYPGVICMKFNSIKAYNKYFKDNPSLLVVQDHYIKTLFGVTVIAMVTNQLKDEEMADLNEVSREVEFAMAERRKIRQEAKEKLEQEQAAKAEEEKRLATVGRKYEERVKHMKSLPVTDIARKLIEGSLNGGDPDVLFETPAVAYKVGWQAGRDSGFSAGYDEGVTDVYDEGVTYVEDK